VQTGVVSLRHGRQTGRRAGDEEKGDSALAGIGVVELGETAEAHDLKLWLSVWRWHIFRGEYFV